MAQESGELDLLVTRHKGQYALRKLYHESPRLLAVFYTSPSCGPCRTLKPIFNKVIDEYGDKVRGVRPPSHQHRRAPPLTSSSRGMLSLTGAED